MHFNHADSGIALELSCNLTQRTQHLAEHHVHVDVASQCKRRAYATVTLASFTAWIQSSKATHVQLCKRHGHIRNTGTSEQVDGCIKDTSENHVVHSDVLVLEKYEILWTFSGFSQHF